MHPPSPEGGRRRWIGTWGFVLLLLAKPALLAPLLVYRCLEWSYPFLGGDGAEWLGEGLAMFGAEVRSTGRQPFLPLVAGLLDQADALRFLPWFPLALSAVLELVLFFLVRRLHGLAVAWACGLYLFLHHGLLEPSVQVMADLPATVLATLAAALLLVPGPSQGRRALAIVCGAAAVLAQQVALIPLAAVVGIRAVRGGGERRLGWAAPELRWSVLSLLGMALPGFLWQVWLRREGGGGAIIATAQWGYLRPHWTALDNGAALALAFFGLPALALVLWQLFRLARRREPGESERAAWIFASLAWLAATGLFLAFLYDYRASRFFLYLLPPFAVLLAEALAALRPRPLLFASLSLAAILGGAWTQGAGPARTGLWPIPPLELVVGSEGEDDPPLRPRLERASYRGLLERSLPRRALLAWRSGAEERPPSIPHLETVRSIVVLHTDETPIEQRYERRARVALTLRHRSKIAPCSLFPPRWRGWGELLPVERRGGLRFLRGTGAGEPGGWLLVVPEECVPSAPLLRSAEPAAWTDRALVAEVERRLPGPDSFVAVVAEGEGGRALARSLALSLHTANFFVLDRAAAGVLPRLENEGARAGPYRLLRVRYRRWPVLLVEPAPDAHGAREP